MWTFSSLPPKEFRLLTSNKTCCYPIATSFTCFFGINRPSRWLCVDEAKFLLFDFIDVYLPARGLFLFFHARKEIKVDNNPLFSAQCFHPCFFIGAVAIVPDFTIALKNAYNQKIDVVSMCLNICSRNVCLKNWSWYFLQEMGWRCSYRLMPLSIN